MADEKKKIVAEKIYVPVHLKVNLSYKKLKTYEIADDTYITVSTLRVSGSLSSNFETCLRMHTSDPDVRIGHSEVVKTYEIDTTESVLDKWHALFCSFVPIYVTNFGRYEQLKLGDKP